MSPKPTVAALTLRNQLVGAGSCPQAALGSPYRSLRPELRKMVLNVTFYVGTKHVSSVSRASDEDTSAFDAMSVYKRRTRDWLRIRFHGFHTDRRLHAGY